MTANHVVRRGSNEATNLRVRFKKARASMVDARVAPHADPNLDLAVIVIDRPMPHAPAICYSIRSLTNGFRLVVGEGLFLDLENRRELRVLVAANDAVCT